MTRNRIFPKITLVGESPGLNIIVTKSINANASICSYVGAGAIQVYAQA